MEKALTSVIYSGTPSQYAVGPAETADAIAWAVSKRMKAQVVSVAYDRLLKTHLSEPVLKSIDEDRAVTRVYIRRNWFMFFRLFRIIKASDGPLILHCIFDYRFVLPALLFALFLRKRPIFHVPHGMLMDVVFERHSLAKHLFCLVWRVFVPRGAIVHVVSSEFERQSVIRHLGGAESISVIPQITNVGECFRAKHFKGRQAGEKLNICFVGRVTKQKNLLFALSVLKELNFEVGLDVYGSTADVAYFSACAAAVAQLPDNISVVFKGSIQRSALLVELRNYDLMFVPTLGDNHGHYILEALSVGLPVLISDKCPWSDINESGGGWSLPLSARSSFVEVLSRAYSAGLEWENVRKAASEYFDSKNLGRKSEVEYQELICAQQ
jgi:glycosyltransferase involved in cell wall biosynthesis